MTDSDSQAVCFRMLEELMQDTDVVMEPKRHNVKQSLAGGGNGVLSVVSPASSLDEGLGSPNDDVVANGSAKAGSSGSFDDAGSSTDEASEVSGVVVTRRGSPVSCCCGDNRGFNVRDNQRDDMTGIVVANGGRFPCLHIGLTGLRHNRRYFLALDFVEVSGCDGTLPYCYTEPYYTPRPNNLPGLQWMGNVLYFNLNSIANGGLQDSGTTLKVGGEYEPTLRLMELRDDQWPSGSSAIRFPLRNTAFLVVSLSSEVRTNRTALASEFLLVRKSEMSSHHQPTPQQQQPPVGSWHSSARQPHSCLAPGAHLEALLHQNRETFSSLVHQGSVSQPRPPMSDFSGGRGGLLAPEPRPSLPPFAASSSSSAAAAAHALQECWSRGGAPSAAPPLFRLNYDLLPSGCLHWLALARNSVVRPQAVATSDMGVQTTTTTTSGSGPNCSMAPCLDDAELAVNDQCISPNAASSSSPHAGGAFYASTGAASTP
ncbi:hypothetical protein MTO96_000749 [Rhipicephalus appendiculatus]